jgi:hypothetical protein
MRSGVSERRSSSTEEDLGLFSAERWGWRIDRAFRTAFDHARTLRQGTSIGTELFEEKALSASSGQRTFPHDYQPELFWRRSKLQLKGRQNGFAIVFEPSLGKSAAWA